MNGLEIRAILANPTAQIEAEAVGATAGSVLTASAGGFAFKLPAPYVAPQYTFATLPASPFVGETAVVTDATVNTWGTAVTIGGGSDIVLVWWNSAAWTVIGS